ncbi:PilZ domain-containing protein [Synechococcus sp. CS-1328]|uniref:PilZ domain-containing protein n=1 Tax=Synechococcus sp. CS-1328 TaxID=2847976 RepID=UPI00223AE8EC|nr:PilZ domain-containing protein [Synechococcus sp. CS-1328]MCT0224857.1 PilZ domain-containing protein [Synechococcus sp. CS-1328]
MWNGEGAMGAGVATRKEKKAFLPRREPRFSVPAFSVQIAVVFVVEGQKYKARLWDVSLSGCCIAIPDKEGSPVPGDYGRVFIRNPSTGEPISNDATVMWMDHVGSAYFVGCKYDKPIELEGTFLAIYEQKR